MEQIRGYERYCLYVDDGLVFGSDSFEDCVIEAQKINGYYEIIDNWFKRMWDPEDIENGKNPSNTKV